MKLKGILSAVLGAAVALTSAATAFSSEPTPMSTAEIIDFSAPSVGLNITEHSRDVIRQYISGHPFDMTRQAEYATAPDGYMPFKNFGKLSDTDLTGGRNALNVMRFIAGVGVQDVTLCPYATEYAQAAALVLNYKGCLTHTIYNDMPGMDMWTLRCAQVGAKNSNLASGFNNPAHSVVMGYMYDTNEKNIGELGHRRWCLNPPMYLTAFGQVGKFGTMYATDTQLTAASNSGICWPAPNTPAEYFPSDTAWSFSLCKTVPADNVKVTLTRKSDMRVWTFSNEQADGYFNVNNDTSVPLYGCVIFRPDDVGGYSHGDVFNVKIEGLGTEVSYNVNFFALDGDDSVFEDTTTSEQEPTENEPEESKTALEFKSEETGIRITADPEVFRENTLFKAQPIESCCSATRYACDLSFVCDGQTIQPNGCVRVSMPIPSGFENYSVLRVYHVESGRCRLVPSTVESGRVCFTASSFSPYILTSENLDGEIIELSAGETDNEQTADTDEDQIIDVSDEDDLIVDDPSDVPTGDIVTDDEPLEVPPLDNLPNEETSNTNGDNEQPIDTDEDQIIDVSDEDDLIVDDPSDVPTGDIVTDDEPLEVPPLDNLPNEETPNTNGDKEPEKPTGDPTNDSADKPVDDPADDPANGGTDEENTPGGSDEQNVPGGSDHIGNDDLGNKGNPVTGGAALLTPAALAFCAAITIAVNNRKKR